MASQFADLPILDQIQIASPCQANWEQMQGDDQKRFCSACNLHVYNLSAMTPEQAESLMSGESDRLCVRLFRRSDGTVLTQDCPVGLKAIRRRFYRMLAVTAATLLSLITSAWLGRSFWPQKSPPIDSGAFTPGEFETTGASEAWGENGVADTVEGGTMVMGSIAFEPQDVLVPRMGKVISPNLPTPTP